MENNQIDKSNLRQVIINFPDQFKTGLELARNIKLDGKFYKISISGMGGSALPANLFRTYANSLLKENPEFNYFDVNINRFYSLPPDSTSSNTLHFVASYSGNTEETISTLEELKSKDLPFIGLSSGGEIEILCKKYNAPHIKLPIPNPSFQPRMGTGYFFGILYQVMINQGLLPDKTTQLLDDCTSLKNNSAEAEKLGQSLAQKLKGKTPVIYSSPKFKSVAMVWKIKINENSKTPAFWNFLPELNHNEMVGYTNPQGKFFIIMLKNPTDNPKNLKRYKATSDILSTKDIESEILDLDGDSTFEKIFSSIALADWTSYYLALAYGQDPTPVELVEEFKKIIA